MSSNNPNPGSDFPHYHHQSTVPPDRAHGRKRLLGVMLIVIGLVWLANSMLPILFERVFGEQRSQSFDQSYSAQYVTIDSTNARVILQHTDEQQVRVRFERDGREQGNVQAELSGDRLHITHDLAPCFFCDNDAVYMLDVPKNVQVEVHSISGDIEVDDIASTLSLSSQSGTIEVVALRGDLKASSSSGDIRVKDSELQQVTLETTSGEIDFKGQTKALSAKSVSGNISIENDMASLFMLSTTSGDVSFEGQPTHSSDISTISGDVEIKLAPESNISLMLNTVSGDLKNNLELSDLIQTPQQLSGRLGKASTELTVHTTSGDVRVGSR